MNVRIIQKVEGSNEFRKSYLRWASALALGLCPSFSALADTTTLTVSSASKGASSVPVMLSFPVARGGDLGYEAVLNYHTMDGTAVAGTDYTAASGSIVIPAGATSATIPVTLSSHTGSGPNVAFQLLLDSATGIGPTPDFTAQQTFGTGASPYSFTAADINGDGKSDLIVANYTDNNVSVLINTTTPGAATPSFAPQQTFAAGGHCFAVTAVDVNGDGKPDLIVANFTTGAVSVLLNTTTPGSATPTFTAPLAFGAGANPASVTTADVNGDGRPDLITANFSGSNVSVLLNTTAPGAATPSFATQQSFATGAGSSSVKAADVNGDGKPDLIVANSSISANSVSVLLNTTAPGATTPSFAIQQTFATGPGTYSVTVADVNGDGPIDLIVANFQTNTVSVLLNTTAPGAATASFAAQQAFVTGLNPASVSAIDVNGDGKADVIVANSHDNTASVLINTTAPGAITPSFAAGQTFATGGDPECVIAADINGDGKPELIVLNSGDNSVSVLVNTTAAVVATPSFSARQNFVTGNGPTDVALADINGDGKLDLLIENHNVSSVTPLLNTTVPGAATFSFAQQPTISVGSLPLVITTADINADGKPDLVVRDGNTSNVYVALNTTVTGTATATFGTPKAFTTGFGVAELAAADVNGDGKIDLIVGNDNDNTISVLVNTTAPGATTPSFAAQNTFSTGQPMIWLGVADVNSDGKPDIISTDVINNTVTILVNTTAAGGLPSFTATAPFATGVNPFPIAAADVNGDGLLDLIIGNYNGNSLSVLFNSTVPGSAVTFATQQTIAMGGPPRSIAIADIDGDGKLDLVVANGSNNILTIMRNTTAVGATVASFSALPTLATGQAPYVVRAADLNGDGKADLIAPNVNDNTVSVFLNNQYQVLSAGSPATGTIVHDYIFANGFD